MKLRFWVPNMDMALLYTFTYNTGVFWSFVKKKRWRGWSRPKKLTGCIRPFLEGQLVLFFTQKIISSSLWQEGHCPLPITLWCSDCNRLRDKILIGILRDKILVGIFKFEVNLSRTWDAEFYYDQKAFESRNWFHHSTSMTQWLLSGHM